MAGDKPLSPKEEATEPVTAQPLPSSSSPEPGNELPVDAAVPETMPTHPSAPLELEVDVSN